MTFNFLHSGCLRLTSCKQQWKKAMWCVDLTSCSASSYKWLWLLVWVCFNPRNVWNELAPEWPMGFHLVSYVWNMYWWGHMLVTAVVRRRAIINILSIINVLSSNRVQINIDRIVIRLNALPVKNRHFSNVSLWGKNKHGKLLLSCNIDKQE